MLTSRRKRFIEAYLVCWNGAEAARRAGYSHRHSRKQASYLLTVPEVRAEIERRLEEAAMGANEVLAKLTDQARLDLGPYVTQDGKRLALDWDKLKEAGLTHLVKSITPTSYGMRIEFHDAQMALIQLGRMYGLFKDRQVKELDPETVSAMQQFAAVVTKYVPDDRLDELKEELRQWQVT